VGPPVDDGLYNPFCLVVVTAQRARQLKDGARPRLDPGGHKPLRVALLEVRAGLVSWETLAEPTLT
jgi:DNA-directed RNA polymerase omega subunit